MVRAGFQARWDIVGGDSLMQVWMRVEMVHAGLQARSDIVGGISAFIATLFICIFGALCTGLALCTPVWHGHGGKTASCVCVRGWGHAAPH